MPRILSRCQLQQKRAVRTPRRRPAVAIADMLCAGVLLACMVASSTTVSGQQPPSAKAKPPAVLDIVPVIAPHRIPVATYDGSGQAVHPDITRISGGWGGWEYWLAFTPYPRGDRRFENPSLAVSRDGEHFAAAPRVKAPLARPPAALAAYESDPDLHLDPATGRLVLVYRQVEGATATLLVQESSDGQRWSEPHTLLRRSQTRVLSPSVVIFPDGSASMWLVDAGTRGCTARRTAVRRSTLHRTVTGGDSSVAVPAMHSSPGTVVPFGQPGYVVWHLDVLYVAATREYWALYAAYPVGARCDAADLFIARSRDGRAWQHAARPLLARGQYWWASASLYRSTLWYDEEGDRVHVVLSGRSAGNVWSLGTAAYALSDWRRAITRRGER